MQKSHLRVAFFWGADKQKKERENPLFLLNMPTLPEGSVWSA
jgi:hypothetical protein